MTRKVSMQTIADALGLSKYAVSQAITGKPGIKEETRQRILAMAKSLGYTYRPLSSASSSGETSSPPKDSHFILAYISGSHQHEPSFWSRVLDGIRHGCAAYSLQQVVVPLTEEEHAEVRFPTFLTKETCAGILLVGPFAVDTILSIKRMDLPAVLVDHHLPMADLDAVVNANLDSAHTLGLRLLEQGCKTIHFLGNDNHSVSFQERSMGVEWACRERGGSRAGITFSRMNLPLRGNQHLASFIEGKLDCSELPDAYICANDLIAIELMRLLLQRRVAIPRQCKVVGFDNIEISAFATPPLTTVENHKEMLGYRAVETLMRRRANPGMPVEKVTLSTRLVARDSG